MGRHTPDLRGRQFGRLTVLRRKPRIPGGTTHAEWVCRCRCGAEIVTTSSALRSGNTQSCGCLRREAVIARNTRNGSSRAGATPTYYSWANMIQRCTNPNHPRFADWGGRGITVEPRWLDYANFLADMGERPAGVTLNRKDNNGPYSHGNCEWAGPAAQAANSRNTKLTPELIAEIARLNATGMTMTAIGRQLELGRHTVAKALFSMR
jgi:hypothetical protein